MQERVVHHAQVTAQAGLFGALRADYLTMKGTYSYPVVIGTIRLWHDATVDCLRVKKGSNPSSEADGTILMEG